MKKYYYFNIYFRKIHIFCQIKSIYKELTVVYKLKNKLNNQQKVNFVCFISEKK